jgi:hypothetical protein
MEKTNSESTESEFHCIVCLGTKYNVTSEELYQTFKNIPEIGMKHYFWQESVSHIKNMNLGLEISWREAYSKHFVTTVQP